MDSTIGASVFNKEEREEEVRELGHFEMLKRTDYSNPLSWRTLTMEAIGTFSLFYGALWAGPDNFLFMNALWSSILIAGDFSGAHMNPAVTFSLVLRPIESFPINGAIGYFVVQLLGSFVGFTLWAAQNDFGSNIGPASTPEDFLGWFKIGASESIGTFFLVFGVLVQSGTHHSYMDNRILGPLAVSLGIMAGRNVSKFSGSMMNPGFAIAGNVMKAVFSGDTDYLLFIPVYFIAPFIGALIAVLIYMIAFNPLIHRVRKTMPLRN